MLFKNVLKITSALIFAGLLITSCSQKEDDSASTQVKNEEELETVSLDKVPFMQLDKYPVFQNCELLSDNNEIKQCTAKSITEHVTENFDIKSVSEFAEKGTNKIFVRFIIDKTGNIKDVVARAPSEELQQEAVRVIQSIPAMVPGEKDGKKVNVQYSLPINFII
ncbi:energy transducer TonB [Aquimarina brevivitae]|uniref:TonB-like protein n=1 Tax=Aquimarina brevivitae TaxID=323412 RepID=A0A4Q7PGU1_9FLAO|nr:energy transducer TonB [Aquimarina brevivitae]RZS99736.1 TonB-like protein [Aquimarina brevivitae]